MYKAAIIVVIVTLAIGVSLGDALSTTLQHHMVVKMLGK